MGHETYFLNRKDAARKLLTAMPLDIMKLEEWIVIAASYGGFLLSKIIAKELNAKVDIMFSEKINAPNNEECEVAVITEHEDVVIHEELVKSFEIDLDYIYGESKQIYHEALYQKVNRLRQGKKLEILTNKNVLIVDEGVNTALTMMACIKTAISLKAKSISVAVPVLSTSSVGEIEAIADDLFYVKKLDHFVELEAYYDELDKVSYEDMEKLIENKGKNNVNSM